MSRCFPTRSLLTLFLGLCFWAQALAAEVDLNGHTFTLPNGFEIELVAGPPLVDRPIVADFDEEGRLYVAESSGTNDPVQKQLAERPHRILRLEDSDGDGKFDRRTLFADRMMFPEGAMWLDGSLYVSAPPSIWKLTDTDGDGIADKRVEWFDGKTLTGCANDLHGPYRGLDGWIYWCKGAFAEQTYQRPGREPLVTRAAHIFRARPDGSGIEPVMTGGMDNPVDVVFTPGGERIFTTTFFQHPGGGQRDGLIHAIYGGVYGKVHDVINNHPRTSPGVMPVLTHMGPAAPCGLARYQSNAFGDNYQDNLFAALFNMQKVTRHVLAPEGATFKTKDEDFLVSSNKDFHPTDVLEDADGSLIVIDTGGWYKLCCPTSQLWKPDVLGGIYRIRRTDAPRVEDPRGRQIAWGALPAEELVRHLDDPRLAVRERAIAILAAREDDTVVSALADAIGDHASARLRRNAIWAATRINGQSARAAVRSGLADTDETVRQAALHSISVWRDSDAVPMLVTMLGSASDHNRRAAAEALGRIGDRAATAPLLAALAQPASRVLRHSLTFALIEIGDSAGTVRGLASPSPRVRQAALVALDQMDSPELTADAVAKALLSANPSLRRTAGWIAGRHPEWGERLADLFRRRLSDENLAAQQLSETQEQLARLASNDAIQRLLAELVADDSTPHDARVIAVRAMADSGLRTIPVTWVEGLSIVLRDVESPLAQQVIRALRRIGLGEREEHVEPLVAALMEVATDASLPAETRLEALAATGPHCGVPSDEVFAFVRKQLAADRPARLRSLSVDVLTRARLNESQLLTLSDSLTTAGPLELDRLLSAFEQSASEQVGLQVVEALDGAAYLTSLRTEMLRPRLARFGDEVQQRAASLYQRLDVGAEQQRARLEALLRSLPEGDIRRGQAVFNGTKAACASCHAIGYLGGTLGPDLTRIGQVRDRRDLLESIVFPSASFVRSYEPLSVQTDDGRLHNGLVQKESPEEIFLALAADQVVRIPRERIEEIQPGTVSIMPAGLDQQLTRDELADLVAFLSACK